MEAASSDEPLRLTLRCGQSVLLFQVFLLWARHGCFCAHVVPSLLMRAIPAHSLVASLMR